MSYNYNSNPWDDDYGGQAGGQSQAGQQAAQYGGYYDGYSNPMSQFPDDMEPGQMVDQQQGAGQQEQFYDQQQEPAESQKKAIGFVSRFLRAHLPLYGSVADTMAGLNLPFIDRLVQHVNRDLLVSKMFYFFFYSAFGSLFPLMGVYFKQLGMNPAQVGILTGVRPFIEIFSAPFWNNLAERFHKSKELLLFSLLSWILFTYSLAHIRPPASGCIAFNNTDFVLYTPYSANDLSVSEYSTGSSASESSSSGAGETMDRSIESVVSGSELQAGKLKSSEGKEEILASEENSNDQRRKRRRRKRRQISPESTAMNDADDDAEALDQGWHPGNRRFVYSVDSSETLQHMPIDLSSDFEDLTLDGSAAIRQVASQASWSQDGNDLSDSPDDDDYNELERTFARDHSRSHASRLQRRSVPSEIEELQDGKTEITEDHAEGDTKMDEGEEEQNSAGEKTTRSKEEMEQKEHSDVGSNEIVGKNDLGYTGPPPVVNKTRIVYKERHKTPPKHIVGKSPITVEYAVNYNKDKHSQFVTPMFSTIVYKLEDIKEVFFLLLLLISLGEFFSAPAITLADSATLRYLGENTDLYGRQRMFGSLSWAITLLLVGMALDSATSIHDHPCGPHPRERSYTVCFVIFSLLMALALLTATQFRFDYNGQPNTGKQHSTVIAGQLTQAATNSGPNHNVQVSSAEDGSTVTSALEDPYAATQPRSIFNTAPPVNAPPPSGQQQKFEFLDKWKSAVFAQRTWDIPQWFGVFRQFGNSLHLMYLFITWFLGCGVGLVFTFLFWHLQDVGGTPTLFGICSVINHISEILAYFFSSTFIKRYGHTKVLSVGLGCNVIRFLYVAFLTNPYYALPFELVQGITHGACFAACCSYMSHVSKPELKTSTQGVMQGLHHGIGRACGTLIGGYMINAIGSRASFCIYGLLSGVVLAGLLYIRKKLPGLIEEDVKVDDSEALGGLGAPQGVPSAVPSKFAATSPDNINNFGQPNYGQYQQQETGSQLQQQHQGQGIPGIDYQW